LCCRTSPEAYLELESVESNLYLSYEKIEAWWGSTAQLCSGCTAAHYNAYDFAEAKRIKHISTYLQNKQ
jgi:hypothetical protein